MVVLFKQKTAYEMRISDWSSDVCSSDLGGLPELFRVHLAEALVAVHRQPLAADREHRLDQPDRTVHRPRPILGLQGGGLPEQLLQLSGTLVERARLRRLQEGAVQAVALGDAAQGPGEPQGRPGPGLLEAAAPASLVDRKS